MKTFLRAQWDRAGALLLIAVGGLALVLGWIGVSGTSVEYEQLSFVASGGLGGLALIGVGATLWLSADLRDEWRMLRRLEQKLDAAEGSPPPEVNTNGSHPGRVSAAIATTSSDR
jgi:hypothetical protein